MKKTLALFLALVMAVGMFVGCGAQPTATGGNAASGVKLSYNFGIYTSAQDRIHILTTMRLREEDGIRFIVQDVKCGTDEEEQTVRSWLSGYGLDDSEEWFAKWQSTIIPLTGRMNAIAEKASERIMNMVAQGLLVALYVNYDREGPFMAQFKENVSKIDGLLTGIEYTINSINSGS